jgi:predicted secreted hydrolase
MPRRQWIKALFLWGLGGLGLLSGNLAQAGRPRRYAQALPGTAVTLPKDHGPHPDFRTEWWYFTGWFEAEGLNAPVGVQITFFRNAPDTDTDNPSRLAPTQLLFAHAAVAMPGHGQLLHADKALRAGLGDTTMGPVDERGHFHLRLGNWHLQLNPDESWQARIDAQPFELDLRFVPTQAPWLQGDRGFSRKGPSPAQASHYITLPHLRSSGKIRLRDTKQTLNVRGRTWMDHEWSTAVLDPQASGWDWVGLHGEDGSSIMAFIIRRAPLRTTEQADRADRADRADKGAIRDTLWAHAELRSATGQRRVFKVVRFEPAQTWTSPRTGTVYPVAMQLQLDELRFDLKPLMPDQELDTRLSTGTIYWEGAVRVSMSQSHAADPAQPRPADNTSPVAWGTGYLELTGYWKPLKL